MLLISYWLSRFIMSLKRGDTCYIHVSYSLNSLKGSYLGDYIGSIMGVSKGDTKSLGYSARGAQVWKPGQNSRTTLS